MKKNAKYTILMGTDYSQQIRFIEDLNKKRKIKPKISELVASNLRSIELDADVTTSI